MLRGTFITSHTQTQNINSKFLVVELLQTENAVEFFCKQYSVNYSTRLSMVIEAYTYLVKMIQTPTISNTHVSPTQIINSKPMMFSQPIKTPFISSNVYDQSSPTTLLIEEQEASPERVEVKHESIDNDHTIEEIEFDAAEDDDDIPLSAPSRGETKSIMKATNVQDADKDDNFFVQQKPGDSELAIVQSDIAPGDSGGTEEMPQNLTSRHNTNQSNSHHSNDSFVCAKCDQILIEPPVS